MTTPNEPSVECPLLRDAPVEIMSGTWPSGRRVLPTGATPPSHQLYRGLKEPYDPSRRTAVGASGVDFTDCPYAALTYATGRKGVVVVIHVEAGAARFSEELWADRQARRLMFWGESFEHLVIARIPAKELRAQVRRRGIVTASTKDKSTLLRQHIERRLRASDTV